MPQSKCLFSHAATIRRIKSFIDLTSPAVKLNWKKEERFRIKKTLVISSHVPLRKEKAAWVADKEL